MKISRISQALGSISDEFSREAIEEIERTSNQNDSVIPDGKPRVVSEEKSRKAPIFIALAGLCAAAAIALPLVLKNVGKNSLVASDNSSGAASSATVEKLGYDLDGLEDYREYKFEFTMPEYEGVAFECMHNKITANGEVIASGLPILQVYLADLNGDGRREIVSDTAFGSGILTKVISACDYSKKQLYMFSNNGFGNYLELFENNGELWVRETEYLGESVLSEKKLELSDMKKIDGFTQEPVRAAFDGDEIPCIDNYESIQEQALESYVFETHTYDEYTVKLVGKQVFKLDKNVTDYVYAKKLCIEVEKDGKLLDSFAPNPGYFNLDGITDRPKFTVFADKVGSYLDLYELEQPVISMRYYFDDNQAVTKAVQFAVIKEGTIYDNFLSTAEAGTGVTLFNDDFATNIEDNLTCFASVFEAEKFRVADSTTLVDDMAGIKYTFNFADMLKTGILTTTTKDDGIIELTGENMTVKIDRLKISHNDRELTADLENFNPNVSFLTVTLRPERCSKFAVVMDEYGNFELFEGDQVSKIKDNSDTSFLEKLPENKFGYMWEYINGYWQWSHSENRDKLHNCKNLFDETDGEEVYQVWISNNADEIRDVCIDFYYNNIVGCTIDIIDNYNGTFSVDSYGSSVISPCTIIFPKAEIALEAVRKSLVEKASVSADAAKDYVQNYACYDLDFDGEAEVLVVNTFGSPAVHVFERIGTTYEESSVFPMKALQYIDYKLYLNPYQNGDERYHYFTFHSGGGTMEADVLGAIKQTESGYEAEYLYSWGTLDYKYIPEPVKKEFYRKGWDKYDLALADSNPNDIPKEELAAILKNYGITLN
ncbi:MAG: hypothetical protein MSH49_01765 [[Eubacterium] saphenum]|nr:hypothetical protein [[Eubacterium] saphenum]